ncbi:MAG: phosphate/phosphite/phosphonate ABC transporter substrate-binding protein [bacterium JZ-2024 1]
MAWVRLFCVLWFLSLAVLPACKKTVLTGSSGKPRPSGVTSRPISIAFVPSRDTEKVLESAQPIAEALTSAIGRPVKATIPVSYAVVVEGLGGQSIDCAFMPSLAFVLARKHYRVEPLLIVVRKGQKTYRGQIVARAGKVTALSDLKGKKFAFTDASSASGHLFAKALLLKNGIDPDKDFKLVMFAGGHDKVLFAILHGSVDAGATFDDARNLLASRFPDIRDRIAVIAYTDPIPNDNVSCGKHLPPDLRLNIKKALLEYSRTSEGKKVLYDLYEIDGFAEPEPGEYAPVEEATKYLNLSLSDVPE